MGGSGKKLSLLVLVVLVLGAVGWALAGRRSTWQSSPAALTPAFVPPASPSPRRLAKDYVYVGGKLLVTEEPVRGAISGSLWRPAGPVNLTDDGTLDWAHWGLSSAMSFDHKTGVGQQISNLSVVGGSFVSQYGDNSFPYNWSDGTPTSSVTSTSTGVFVNGANNGFRITLPADTTTRTLKLYVGSWRAQGKIDVRLSDSTVEPYINQGVGSSDGTSNGVYTINFKANAPGQTLTVTYTMSTSYHAYANVTIQAATLTGGGTGSDSLVGSVASVSSSSNLTYQGSLDWAHWGMNSASAFNHKNNVSQQISNRTVLGTGTVGYFGDRPYAFTWTDGTPTSSANTVTGLLVSGIAGNGFQITVPADRTTGTLVLYVGVWYAQGKLYAHLSDNSAPGYEDTSINNNSGSSRGAYTINYRSASEGQTLTVAYTLRTNYFSPYGNITFEAATLSRP